MAKESISRLARAREMFYNKRMKQKGLFFFLCVTLCLTGCMSTEVSKSEVCGIEHIYTSDYGWKLLNCIPLFRPDITIERVQKELASEANRRGKTVSELVYHTEEEVTFNIPLVVITLPIPYVLCYHEVQLSGVLQ